MHALTDVTGFGLAGPASEIAEGSRATIVLDTAALPIIDGAGPWRCVEFAFDAQTSEGLLIAVDPGHVDRLVEARLRPSSATSSRVKAPSSSSYVILR